MKNTISQRVADFLKNYPPFSFLSLREINTLSEEVSIIYKEKESQCQILLFNDSFINAISLNDKNLIKEEFLRNRIIIKKNCL